MIHFIGQCVSKQDSEAKTCPSASLGMDVHQKRRRNTVGDQQQVTAAAGRCERTSPDLRH
jgi:hypothetical protein